MFVEPLPKTDEAAVQFFTSNYPAGLRDTLIALFRLKRRQGDSVLDAYEKVLLAHAGAHEKARSVHA